LFALWFIAAGYAIVISLPNVPPWARLALSLVLLLQMYDRAVTAIAWVSGWLPALTAVLVITWLRSKRAALGLLLALAVLATLQWSFIQQEVFEEAERDGSYERLTLWDLNLELIREHPLVGTGPAGYAIYYMTYHPEEARSTHNNYLDIIAQTGIIGLLCWLWLMAAAAREAWLALRHAPPGWPRTLSLAAAGGLAGAVVAMALGDWVLPFAYNQGIEGYRYTVFSWMFLGVLISVRQQVAPRAERRREQRVSLIQARRAQLAASGRSPSRAGATATSEEARYG
jgi:O-antigen ligase